MKNECSIVRDLLPLYAEGMLSEDSAAFVKEHLDTCEECRALSAGEEPSAPTDADTEQRTGEAGVLRTLKKKLRKQTWCAIVITVAVVLLVTLLLRLNPIDYLADILWLSKREVITVVERMRQEGILADSKDISAYLQDAGDSERKSQILLERFAKLEQYILNHIPDGALRISCKQLNENAVNDGINTSKEKDIRTLLYFLTVKGYTRKKEDAARNMEISRQADLESTIRRFEKRLEISRFAVEWLYKLAFDADRRGALDRASQLSVVGLLSRIKSYSRSRFGGLDDIQLEDVEEALLYLSKIGSLKLEGGFLVLYNAMNIQRIKDNKSRYKQDDYRMLNEFYKLKIQQVHIVGEYANLMVRDYHAA